MSQHSKRPTRKWRTQRPRTRRGAATVELAIVLPVMMIIVFGTLEVCQRMLLRESAAVAAYETARLAARRTVTVAKAQTRGEQILAARQVTGGTVEITPGTLNTLPTGAELQVRVRVPIAGNSSINYVLPVTGEIEVVTTMLRE